MQMSRVNHERGYLQAFCDAKCVNLQIFYDAPSISI